MIATRSQSRLGLVHVVGGQHDRAASVAKVADHVPELPARLRVQTGGRLVKEQKLGVADQGDGDRQPLLLAAGELLDEGVRLAFERDAGDHVVRARGRCV